MRSRSIYTFVFAVALLFVGASTAFAAGPQDRTWGEAIWPHALLTIYCVLIVGGSLAGGWLPSVIDLNHNRMQVVISFVGGLMLGIGVFHLLPHAVSELHAVSAPSAVNVAVGWMMFGMLVMFFLIRSFHVHHHGPLELPDATGTVVEDSYRYELQDADASHAGHAGPCAHDHSDRSPASSRSRASRMSWVGIALGLSLHTLIDGAALGAAIRSAQGTADGLSLLGAGTFLAVFLHKPLDAVSITSLMAAGGWTKSKRNLVNFGFSLMCPLGAAVFILGVDKFPDYQHEIVGAALAFAAGVFLCISLGDLLPEMEFHSHNRLRLTVALLLGIAVAWAIGFLEPSHVH